MLQLTHPDLPDESIPEGQGGCFLRLYKGSSRTLAPLFKYNRFASYYPGSFDEVDIPLTTPNYGGLFFQLTLDFEVTTYYQITTATTSFLILDDPYNCAPGTAWGETNTLNLYANPSKSIASGDTLAIVCDITASLPEPVNNVIVAELDDFDRFIATLITTSGLRFSPAVNPSSPVTGEFVQSGDVVSIYVSTTYQPILAAPATFKGLFTVTVPDEMAAALSFDLSTQDVDYIDGADYLGATYNATSTPYVPLVGELFWNTPVLTLLAPLAVGRRLIKAPDALVGMPGRGAISYESFEEG